MTQELTIYENTPPERATAEGITAWLAQWVAPDAQALELADDEMRQMAVDVVKEIKAKAKQLEDAEKSVTSGIVKSLAIFRSWFAPGKELAKKGVALWNGKILESEARQKRETAAAMARVEVELQKGNTEAAMVAHREIKPVTKLVGMQKRKIWKTTILNPDLIPDEFWSVDPAKIEAERKRQLEMYPGETPTIAGVKFYQEETLASV